MKHQRHKVQKITSFDKDTQKSTTYYMIDYRVDGKRTRRYFDTKTAANEALSKVLATLRESGSEGMIRPDLRVMALKAEHDLKPFGCTISDAVAFYVKHLQAVQRSITVRELVDKYMVTQVKNSLVHQNDLRIRYGRFCEKFGERLVHEISQDEIRDWIKGLGLGPVSQNNWRERISFLFGYAVKRKYLESNPINKDYEPETPIDEAPEIFTVDEVSKLLNAATPNLLPIFALGAFTGIRIAELLRLDWGQVNFKTGFVEVLGRNAKSRSHRAIEMHPNLLEWLAPYIGSTGKIWKGNEEGFKHERRMLLKSAGITRWPKNVLRHSFASYHLGFHQNANSLALDMGHTNTGLIFSNYRALTTKAESERYWNVRPPAPAENVVQISAAA